MKFIADFDRAGLSLTVAAILIILYFGLTSPGLVQDIWVAVAFWMIGFFGSFMFFTRRSIAFSFVKLLTIAAMTGLCLLAFVGMNIAYLSLIQTQQVVLGEKLLAFSIGICEELFFGVFLLGLLINAIGLNPVLALLISSGAHTLYHIPNWGSNPMLMMFFFTCFLIVRTIYVYVYQSVGMLLGTHGLWNFGVG